MAKAASPFNVKPFDLDAALAFQRANVETMVQANTLVVDATQKAFRLHAEWTAKIFQNGQKAFDAKTAIKPEQVMADAESLTKEAMQIAKDNVDLGVETQRKVADLVTKRVEANITEMKAAAA